VIHDSNLEFNIFKENNKDMSELDSIVLPLVKELVEDFGASVNPTTPSYLPHALATPLGAAIDNLLLEVVQYLLKKGADITYAVHGKTLLEFMKEVSAENDNIFDVEIFDIENPEEISENNNNEENSDHDNSSETPIIGEDNNNDSPSDIN
jgi:hypothetical protein